MQLVDNTLLLGGAPSIMTKRYNVVLDKYFNTFGGKVNKWKRNLYTWNVSTRLTQRITQVLGFFVVATWNFFTYLGIYIVLGTTRASEWQGIIDKMKNKMDQ